MQDYNPINNFLEKFKKILFRGEGYKKVITDSITKHMHIEMDPSTITSKGSVIILKVSPLLKGEVLMQKEKILANINALLPDRRFTDIR